MIIRRHFTRYRVCHRVVLFDFKGSKRRSIIIQIVRRVGIWIDPDNFICVAAAANICLAAGHLNLYCVIVQQLYNSFFARNQRCRHPVKGCGASRGQRPSVIRFGCAVGHNADPQRGNLQIALGKGRMVTACYIKLLAIHCTCNPIS